MSGELEHELATGTQGKKRALGTGMVRAGFMGKMGVGTRWSWPCKGERGRHSGWGWPEGKCREKTMKGLLKQESK